MTLTSPIAKDILRIINKGIEFYDPAIMLSDIEGFRKRGRMTNAEAEYLKGLVEAQMQARIENLLND